MNEMGRAGHVACMGRGKVVGSCKRGNIFSGSIQLEEFHD